jgi:predicted kinase
MCRGLPASGKSFWAKQYAIENPNTAIVTKDDIRIAHPEWKEHSVLVERDRQIVQALADGNDVISADCNLNPFHEKTLRRIANEIGADFEIKDFTTPLEECIERDKVREKPVGEKVILDMYAKYLRPYTFQEGLPWCILVDMDGTLSQKCDRDIYDYTKVINDYPVTPVIDVLQHYGHACELETNTRIFILSGRDDNSMTDTIKWMRKHNIPFDDIFMRKTGDKRDDAIVKRELFDEHIRNKYNVRFVIDDRKRVKRMWNRLGVFVLDVNQYDESY